MPLPPLVSTGVVLSFDVLAGLTDPATLSHARPGPLGPGRDAAQRAGRCNVRTH